MIFARPFLNVVSGSLGRKSDVLERVCVCDHAVQQRGDVEGAHKGPVVLHGQHVRRADGAQTTGTKRQALTHSAEDGVTKTVVTV